MRVLLTFFIVILTVSCNTSVYVSTFANKNVYKTKSNLTVQKVYSNRRPTTDPRDFTIVPNNFPTVTKTTTVTTTTPASGVGPAATPSQTTLTTVTSTNPPTATTTTVGIVPAVPAATVTSTTIVSNIVVPAALTTNDFIRYKVVSDEGDFKYIKVLSGCHFTGTPPKDTSIISGSPASGADNPSDYIFQVSKKALVPNTHYLASSAIIGKLLTLPVRVRNEYWNDNNKVLQGVFSLGYGFGWKYKIGNNPYHSHYFSTILYAAGISQQKYFSIAGKYVADNRDSISAKTDEFAVTFLSFGITYEYERFNIGFFMGKDKMFGQLKNWAYQSKWWWGIGIGYELFK